MKAAIFEEVGQAIRIYHDVDIIDPRAGEVRVKVSYCIEEINEAFKDLKAGKGIRTVLSLRQARRRHSRVPWMGLAAV
jgi:Zn-dependent alcohol dehydrogenase